MTKFGNTTRRQGVALSDIAEDREHGRELARGTTKTTCPQCCLIASNMSMPVTLYLVGVHAVRHVHPVSI